MVAVDVYQEITEAQREWLEKGGRNRIERMAERFMKIWKKTGKKGDFFYRIYLPIDILLVAKEFSDSILILRFYYNEIKLAEKVCEHIRKYCSDVETLTITTVKDYWGLGDLTIVRMESWHGNEAYSRVAEYCSTVTPPGLFEKRKEESEDD